MWSKWNEQKEEAKGASTSHRLCEEFILQQENTRNWLSFFFFFFFFFWFLSRYFVLLSPAIQMSLKKTLRLQRDKQHSSTRHKSIQSSYYLLNFFKNGHFFCLLKPYIFWFKTLKSYLYLAKAPFKEANLFPGMIYTVFQ